MDKSRFEWKVGLFVFIGLVLLAALLLQFSKGTSLFRPTYDIAPARQQRRRPEAARQVFCPACRWAPSPACNLPRTARA